MLPTLFTFDGQARSGKGTVVHAVKRSLQSRHINTMLIDAGQVFRVLVVSAIKHGVNVDSPDDIDMFLSNEQMLQETKVLVKEVYHMDNVKSDALLYTSQVGADSAKIGARPRAQEFKDDLLRKWLSDAIDEGCQVVLIDGRALEEVGSMLEDERLCHYRMGFYFLCNPQMGARRTLGYVNKDYNNLSNEQKHKVDELSAQIVERNHSDINRSIHPIVPPKNAPTFVLPDLNYEPRGSGREMIIVDTSADITRDQMVQPFVKLFEKLT